MKKKTTISVSSSIFITILILIIPSVIPISNPTILIRETKQLNLLRVEHYLELEATENTDQFYVHYAFPPDYNYQVPIVLELFNDTTNTLLDYQIQKDCYQPNRIINFTLQPMQKNEHRLLHFTIWVLVETHDFSDIPKETSLPYSKWENPEDTQQWLMPSDVVQSRRIRIRTTANRLEGTDDNILSYATNASRFIFNHRHTLFLIQLWTNSFLSQDALTTLLINGENVGRGHLACALFRSQNIPARMLLVHNDQGFWTQMHYMVEYYIPSYGWVLLDPTYGATPYPTNRQVINRICSIDDEENTKHDFIYPFMKGLERWIWIDASSVHPFYVDCEEGSKSQMFTETVIDVPTFAADYTFFRTQNTFSQYEKFNIMELSAKNQNHFENATSYQTEACNSLVKTKDINEFVYFIEKAYDEYLMINE